MRFLNLFSMESGRQAGMVALLVPIVMTTSALAQRPIIVRPMVPRPTQAKQTPPVVKSVKIDLTGLTYRKKDDPFPGNNDEPYLIGVAFKAKLQTGADGAVSSVLNTVEVWPVGFANHKDLGHSDSNWAKEGGRYQVKGQTLETSLNVSEPGWIAGEVAVFFEEDDWGNKQVDQAKNAIIDDVRKTITTMNMKGLSASTFTDQILTKVSSNVGSSLASFKMKDIYHSLMAAINPDDFGGVNIVLITTAPNNALKFYAGDPSALNAAVSPVKNLVMGQGGLSFSNFTLSYPVGAAIAQMDPAARYSGSCTFSGYVQIK